MTWILTAIIGFFCNLMAMVMDVLMILFIGAIDIGVDKFSLSELGNLKTLDNFFLVFPLAQQLQDVFIMLGFLILYLILIYQLFKAFFGPFVESEDPVKLTARTCFFTILVQMSPVISKLIISLFIVPFHVINTSRTAGIDNVGSFFGNVGGIGDMLSNINVAQSFTGFVIVASKGLISQLTGITVVLAFLALILFGIMCTQYVKFLIEFIERYVILGFLAICAPLAIACGASQNTKHIYSSWIQMMISQGLLMCFGIFFLQVFNSSVAEGMIKATVQGSGMNLFTVLLFQLAWLRLATRVDQHLATAGLGVAQAGGGLGADLFMGARAAMPIAGAISDKALGTNISNGVGGKGGGRVNPVSALGQMYQKGKNIASGIDLSNKATQGISGAMRNAFGTDWGIKNALLTGQSARGQKQVSDPSAGESLLKHTGQLGKGQTVQGHVLKTDGNGGISGKIASSYKDKDGNEHFMETNYASKPFKDAHGNDAKQIMDKDGNSMWFSNSGDVGGKMMSEKMEQGGFNPDNDSFVNGNGQQFHEADPAIDNVKEALSNADFTNADETGIAYGTASDGERFAFFSPDADISQDANADSLYSFKDDEGNTFTAMSVGSDIGQEGANEFIGMSTGSTDCRDVSGGFEPASYKENSNAGTGSGSEETPSDMLYAQDRDGQFQPATEGQYKDWQAGKKQLFTAPSSHGAYDNVQSDGFDSSGHMRSKVLDSTNPIQSASFSQNATLQKSDTYECQTRSGSVAYNMDYARVNHNYMRENNLKEGSDYQREGSRIIFTSKAHATKAAIQPSVQARSDKGLPERAMKTKHNSASSSSKSNIVGPQIRNKSRKK